ncbi:membrane protein [Agaricicola taiwanensis]|uniref:Membrane protein n=1 Tax=Agaricicola taiwanensis TaxID=591372 RepID=A0A8J3DWR5_9RHOB|nr:DUF2232 domain-containing protein [Agaricicola taiwanensis]GGE46939.1 membrane protein [Agaricicola taiwanensis]
MMKRFLPVGLGAGIASALLFASLGSGSILSLALFQIAPLPILLAAIGWGQAAGLIAAGIAGLSVLAALGVEMGALHLASVGVPSWWLAHLALLSQPNDDGDVAWYPIGRLVLWAAAIAIGIAGLSALVIGGSVSGYEALLRENLLGLLNNGGAAAMLPEGMTPENTADLIVFVMPPAFAAFSLVITLINLWIAARVARASGRLIRPWPDLVMTRFPTAVLPTFTLAVLVMFLPDPFAFFGRIAATVLLLLLALIGLTVIHFATRGSASQPFVLIATYLLLFVQIGTLFVVAVLGIAEQLFGLRARIAARRSSSPPRS